MTTNKTKYLYIFITLPLALSGCLGTRHLKKNESILFNQGIQAPVSLRNEDLSEVLVHRANRKPIKWLPFSIYTGAYYLGANRYDTGKYMQKIAAKEKKFDKRIARVNPKQVRKINNLQFKKKKKTDKLNDRLENGNLFMQWGEPIAVFDSAHVMENRDRLHQYLFSKGYFRNNVTFKVSSQKFIRQKTVTYHVVPGNPYIIDTVMYSVKDTAILNILNTHTQSNLIKQDAKYDQSKFTQEHERIEILLKDHGYYDFTRQYIEFSLDTAYHGVSRIGVLISISDPAKREFHKKFIIDSVTFTPDAGAAMAGTRQVRSYRGISYQFIKKDYNLKILTQRVFILPGQTYSRTNTFKTQRQLANLDAFKFVNVNYDTTGGKFTAHIFTSPLDRYQWSNEAGVNVTQGFPGPFYNIGFKKRNVFRGLESFDLTGRIGYEGVASATHDQNIYQSTEAGANASFTFPQFLWPFREKTMLSLGQYNPKTKFTLGYSFSERPEYKRTTTSFSHIYSWENNRMTRYEFTPGSLNIIYSEIKDPRFAALLDQLALQGNNLRTSFSPSFVSNILFNVTWNAHNYGNREQNSFFVRSQFESGGALWNIAKPDFITNQGLKLFKFLRFDLDIRRNYVVKENTILAYRIHTGAAYPYNADKSLPYEKFFFAGGSNSIRAWRPRRIGPGTFKPDSSANPVADGLFTYSIEKPADIILEGSLELRQKLFGFIDGALFVDIGNTWTFRPLKKIDPATSTEIQNGNSQFQLNTFYKELGIGTGFGLRFDFTFLILRFDVGIKVLDPARDQNERFVLDKLRFFKPFATQLPDGTFTHFKEPVIYNIGIGFPF